MSALSNTYENSTLDHLLGTAALTSPSTVYVALFTSAAGLETDVSGDWTEITTAGSAYARQSATFAGASSGSSATNANITFSAATADWGTISHVAVMDAATGGSVIVYGALDVAKEILNGDQFLITTGNLTITLD
tara:strand:+ start:333 stop:737 length:405 start_codon:yes stop_codon:yes gene_type:complete